MKIFTTTAFLLFACLTVHSILPFGSQDANAGATSDLQQQELKGNVRSIKSNIINMVRRAHKWEEGPAGISYYLAYDKNGMKTEETEYSQKNITSRKNYVHKTREEDDLCDKLKLKEKLKTSFAEQEDERYSLFSFCKEYAKESYRTTYIYDVPGGTGNQSLVRLTVKTLNKKKLIVLEFGFDSTYMLEYKKSFKYAKNSDMLEIAEYDSGDNLFKKETFSYDKVKKIRTVTVTDENGSVLSKSTMEYRLDLTPRKKTDVHFDKGELVSSRVETDFDGSGHKMTDVHYSGEPDTPLYEYGYVYEFDKHGNWTKETRKKMIFFYDKKVPDTQETPRVIKREIVYY